VVFVEERYRVTAASSGTHTHAGARSAGVSPVRARLRDTEATGGGHRDTGGDTGGAPRCRRSARRVNPTDASCLSTGIRGVQNGPAGQTEYIVMCC